MSNRSYEIMFIVRPDIEEAEIDKIVETFSGYVTQGDVVVDVADPDQAVVRRILRSVGEDI